MGYDQELRDIRFGVSKSSRWCMGKERYGIAALEFLAYGVYFVIETFGFWGSINLQVANQQS